MNRSLLIVRLIKANQGPLLSLKRVAPSLVKSFSTEPAVAKEEPIQTPPGSNEEKVFPPKLHKIVDEIEKLTLLEVSELNQLLKKRLNIKDAPMMAMGAMPVAAAPAEEKEEEGAPQAVKSAYAVKLVKFDEAKKVALIKEIKGIVPGLNLVQAKKFVESVPQVLKSDLSKEEAEKMKAHIESLGGTVSVE